MKKTILIVLAALVLFISLYGYFTAPNEAQPTANKAQVIDDNSQPVSHAKPELPPGCATVECKGIKGHVSKGDEILKGRKSKQDELPRFEGNRP